jgi:hypothetical protein
VVAESGNLNSVTSPDGITWTERTGIGGGVGAVVGMVATAAIVRPATGPGLLPSSPVPQTSTGSPTLMQLTLTSPTGGSGGSCSANGDGGKGGTYFQPTLTGNASAAPTTSATPGAGGGGAGAGLAASGAAGSPGLVTVSYWN